MHFKCASCHAELSVAEKRYRCACGGYLTVEPEQLFDPGQLHTRDLTIWRYREAFGLPHGCEALSLGEGRSPLLRQRIAETDVWIKLDSLQPSASFKDRGAAVLMSYIRWLGITDVVEDSSGNAGAAASAYAAAAGMRCRIFTPDYTPAGKLVQMRLYGSTVKKVTGTRNDAMLAAVEASRSGYYASHLWNPYFVMGLKSCAFEIWEQLGRRAPESVVVPLGSGGNLEGIYDGFRQLHQAGLVDGIPRMIGVQSAACAPLHDAFVRQAKTVREVPTQPTVAEGIAVARPPRAAAVLAALRSSGGCTLEVGEQEIIDATRILFRMGIFVETTSAAAVGGWLSLPADERHGAVIVLTGHGLKGADKYGHLFPET